MKHNIFNPAQVLLIAALLAAYTVSATTTTTTTTTTYYWPTTTADYSYAILTVTPNVTYTGSPVNITIYGNDTIMRVSTLAAYYQNAWHSSNCGCNSSCTRTWTVTENTPGNYTYKGVMNDFNGSIHIVNTWPENITVRVLPTTTTTSTTTTSSTTSTTMPCAVPGDYPPCATVTLAEVVDYIILWSAGQANLGSVIDLINAWVMSG